MENDNDARRTTFLDSEPRPSLYRLPSQEGKLDFAVPGDFANGTS
jgi:hypothetical protein